MNVVFIPSWYPTDDAPIVGIFVRDQALAIAKHHPYINIGISLWGSHISDLLIKKRDGIMNIGKLNARRTHTPYTKKLAENCVEYFHPEFTWSRRILNGNIEKIIQANLINISNFEHQFGKVDLIHAHMGHPGGYIASHISQEHSIPYIITEQMSPFPSPVYLDESGKLDHWLSRGYDQSAANICVGHDQLNTMESFGINRLHNIPNLVDESFFISKPSSGITDTFRFFNLGRLEDQKGVDILLKAFQAVNQSNPMTELHIGGDGDLKDKLHHLCDELGLKNNVIWHGLMDRAAALEQFQACHAFVLASRHESFGIVLCEAIACGKPIVTTLCGGPKDIIDDSIGYSSNTEDPEDLSTQMLKMIKNHNHFEPEKITNYFLENFSSKVISQKIVDLYNEILL